MELWGWFAGYLVLFALLHLVLYYVYVRDDDGESARSPSLADPDRASSRSSPGPDRYPAVSENVPDPEEFDASLEFDGDPVQCPHCGAHNAADQTYTYCWNCVTTLRQ